MAGEFKERPDDFVYTPSQMEEGKSLTVRRLYVRRANGEPVYPEQNDVMTENKDNLSDM